MSLPKEIFADIQSGEILQRIKQFQAFISKELETKTADEIRAKQIAKARERLLSQLQSQINE